MLTGFPDITESMDEVITVDNKVVVRWTATGTHTGEFMGYAPTGKSATWTGINIFEIECDRITRVVTELDALGRLEQLGLAPAPEATPAP
jgi:predicted ester cyclase